VSLGTEGEHLRLTIADNGRGFATEAGEEPVLPASLNGRVREAGGGLEVSRAAGETSIVIHLPLEAAA
jgi:signal transduction histidine kinase